MRLNDLELPESHKIVCNREDHYQKHCQESSRSEKNEHGYARNSIGPKLEAVLFEPNNCQTLLLENGGSNYNNLPTYY